MAKRSGVGFASLTEWLSLGGIVCLVVVSLMVTVDAVMRNFFAHPIMGVGELTPLLSAIAVGSFLPLSMREDSHISVRLLLSVGPRPIRVAIELFGLAASLAVLLLIGRGLALYTLASFENGTTTGFLPVPIAPSWALVTVLVFVTALVQVWLLVRTLKGKGDHSKDEAGGEETEPELSGQ